MSVKIENLSGDEFESKLLKCQKYGTGHCDGTGMQSGYIMFEIYELMLKDAKKKGLTKSDLFIKFPKSNLSGETIVDSKFWRCRGDNIPSDVHHLLGNFMPYPATHRYSKGEDCHRSGLQLRHSGDPFKMLKNFKDFYTDPKEYIPEETKTPMSWSWHETVASYSDYWCEFNSYTDFVKAMKLEPFDDINMNGEKSDFAYINNNGLIDWYESAKKCLKDRTLKILDIPGVRDKLERYFNAC
ncbi:hypothetical protein FACS1894125_2940 [Actinomycetota bacterium]|nr:hypothetical protein FACS1894125_2940 [Actinomycetota bacterium]